MQNDQHHESVQDWLSKPLGDIAASVPGSTAVFHRFKLDFCCGGACTLGHAFEGREDDPSAIIEALNALGQADEVAVNWQTASDQQLIEHILTRYHEVHRAQLPDLIHWASKVEAVHADHPDCPKGLAAFLGFMQNSLEDHMLKEERILFPMIQRGFGRGASQPVAVMRHEHDEHGLALQELDILSHSQHLPEDACATWRALYEGLAVLKVDLMEHIHLENNILFQRIDGRLGSK